jgi:hypothetical protein
VVYHIAVSSTALLFFFRVRAVFNNNRYVSIVFFIIWLSVLGGSLTAITSLTGIHIDNTKYCTFSNFQPYRSSGNITLAIFDTCVFAAITGRLSNNQSLPNAGVKPDKSRFSLFGKYLPAFSRALL